VIRFPAQKAAVVIKALRLSQEDLAMNPRWRGWRRSSRSTAKRYLQSGWRSSSASGKPPARAPWKLAMKTAMTAPAARAWSRQKQATRSNPHCLNS
jgi:hypothetical protein